MNLGDCDVDIFAGNIKEMLQGTAQEVLRGQRKKKQPWVMNDILDLCD